MSKWFDYFQRCGNVELAFRRAETWNEGVTGKRFKTNPVDFVTLTLRTDGITISGEPGVAEEVAIMFQIMGMAEIEKKHLSLKGEKSPSGRLYIYCNVPKRGSDDPTN